jgi:hypothetical protein
MVLPITHFLGWREFAACDGNVIYRLVRDVLKNLFRHCSLKFASSFLFAMTTG